MKKISYFLAINIGLAIFTMFFGAGNLMYTPKVGIISGDKALYGTLGFILTAVIVPILGIICSLLFYGNYEQLFGRLGKIPGNVLIAFCMLISGPLILMPRLIAFSYEITKPFLYGTPLWLMSFITVALVFVFTYRPSKLLTLLGSIMGPLKLSLLAFLILEGLLYAKTQGSAVSSSTQIFLESLLHGYKTLDLVSALFFGAVIISVLKKNLSEEILKHPRIILAVSLQGAAIAAITLGIVYTSIILLGSYHGTDLLSCNEGEAFSTLCFRVIGANGALFMALAVAVACFSTLIALTAIIAQYVNESLTQQRVSYTYSLIGTLAFTLIPANLGLAAITKITTPLVAVVYPVLIVLTVCNILYKLTGFKYIKLPVFITLLAAIIFIFW